MKRRSVGGCVRAVAHPGTCTPHLQPRVQTIVCDHHYHVDLQRLSGVDEEIIPIAVDPSAGVHNAARRPCGHVVAEERVDDRF